MSRNTSNGSEASDGSWFLEAVGAKPRTPSSSEAVAELTAENTTPDIAAIDAPSPEAMADMRTPGRQVAVMAFDGDPGTSTSSFHPVPLVPPEPDLERLAQSTQESPATDATVDEDPTGEIPAPKTHTPDPVEDDTQLSPALRTRRNFRWPVVIALTLLIAAVVVAAWWLPQSVDDAALATRQSYYDAAAEVRNQLPSSQAALDAITNPDSDEGAVAASVTPIAELDTAAFALVTATAEPLPTTLPLVPTGPLDALVPLRDSGAILGGSSSDLGRRLGTSYVYRTSIPLLLITGPLPATATTQEVNEISVRLAGSLASDAAAVADLPSDPTFEISRVAASAAVNRYAAWQDQYLEALTSEDADAAAVLIAEIDDIRTGLVSVNDDALIAFRTEADSWIVRLAGELETYMEDLTAP